MTFAHRAVRVEPGAALPYDEAAWCDTLVTVGRRGHHPAFRKLLAEGPFPTPAAGYQTDE